MISSKNLSSIVSIALFLFLFAAIISCSEKKESGHQRLPYLGRHDIVKNEKDGKISVDTVYHSIADFRFVNQDSAWITNETFEGKIYVADFFFTSCPDICPKMNTQMLRVYDSLREMKDLAFLSHTIDPVTDSVRVLKDFADRLGVSSSRWHFVTGEKEVLYKLGQVSYMASMADEGPGGLVHSGRFFLIDKERRIRGAYDGTEALEVNDLIRDIQRLAAEYEK